MSEPPRRDKRIAVDRALLVRCESWAEFVAHYATDISQGGMFIVTDEPPELLSEIEVQMALPEGHDVLLRAQVVHVVDAALAARDGRPAGIGVQFLELDAMRKAQIMQLVDFARWEGASGRSTLASRMFEAAASLPPEKVMQALPETPPTTRPSAAAPVATHSSSPARPQTDPAKAKSQRPRRSDGAPAASSEPSSEASAEAPHDAAASQVPPARVTGKPLDTERLKMGMTHLAHRRYGEAIRLFEELAAESPQDPQPPLWSALARARLKLKGNDHDGAAEHYRRVLTFDESNHEARKFVREHGQKKRLEALPFGRYFVKK